MIRDTFEDLLFHPESENLKTTVLPSPEQLKRRILISTKPPKDHHIIPKITNNMKSNKPNDSDGYNTVSQKTALSTTGQFDFE